MKFAAPPVKTSQHQSASTLPTLAEITRRRKTRPTLLSLTSAKRRRSGAQSPLATGARPPPATGAQPPPASGARLSPASSARSLPAAGAQSPPAAGAQSLPAFGAQPTRTSRTQSPPASGARPPITIKRDRPITPDIERTRSFMPPIPWFPPPLISSLRRTPEKSSIATQTNSYKNGIDVAIQTKRRGGKARKALFNNNLLRLNNNPERS
ncbi:mucin-7-like [Polyergus mexicanus]|uniref:mucin-7-like n=1 Tax=Polyergus mexicanus TaxID=615972 RepID=UPI0038B5A58D